MRTFFKLLVSAAVLGSTFAVEAFYLPQTAEAASCRNGIGVSRTVTLNTNGGARFGSSHGGHRDFLRHKEVVLTFDDGPVPGTTNRILHELGKHCAKATFFMVGRMARNNPSMVRKIANSGHTVGIHSDTHRNLGSTNGKAAIQDVDRSIRSIHKAAGRKVSPFFRFPYLSENRSVNAYLKKRDYGVFAIDVDSLDYRFGNSNAMVNRVMSELKRKGKGIILLHDIQKVTANGIGELLTRLNREGYKLVHIRGRGGREISDPVVLASLAEGGNEPEVSPKRKRNSAIKRNDTVKAKRLVRTAKADKRQNKSDKPNSVRESKPSKPRVVTLTKRQRDIIKKRQLAFLQKTKKQSRAFREQIRKRMILR